MKYRCNHCDINFESDKKDKPRCPECMGIHDVEPTKDEKNAEDEPQKGKRPFFIPALILLVIIAGSIVYLAIQKKNAPSDAPQDINPQDVKTKMESLGVELDDAIVPFESSPAVESFAKKAAKGKSGQEAIEALAAHLAALKKEGKWRSYPQKQPRSEGPITATELVDKFTEKEPFAATSYEVACLLFAAGTALEVENLKMVEILFFKKEKAPADPAAIYSRYAVVAGATLFDPWAGRQEKADSVNIVSLDAATATAPFYAHRSLSKFAKIELPEALADNTTAVELAPDNATFKIHRGKIFLGSSAVQEAVAEFEKAKKTHDWAVTKVALAQLSMMTQGNVDDAEADIRDALTEFPEYHQAHAVMAALFMMRGDADSAKQELKIAEKISPASPEVASTFAQLYAMEGNSESAISYAKKAVRLSKENFQTLIVLAQIYRATARFDEMRAVVAKAMKKAPAENVRQEIKKAFNFSEDDSLTEASEPESDSNSDSEAALDLPVAPAPKNLKLNLQSDKSPLGGKKLRLGGSKRPGLGGNLKLEMNQ